MFTCLGNKSLLPLTLLYWNHLIARHAAFGDKLAVRTRVLRRARGQAQRLFLQPTRMIERHLVRRSQNVFWDARQWRLFFLGPYEKTPLSPHSRNGKGAGIFHVATATPLTSRRIARVEVSPARRPSQDAGAALPGLRYVVTSQPFLISKASRALALPQRNVSITPLPPSARSPEDTRPTSTFPRAKRAAGLTLTMAPRARVHSLQATTPRAALSNVTFGRRFSGVRYVTSQPDSSVVVRRGLALRFAPRVTHAVTAPTELTWRPATSPSTAAPAHTPPSRVTTAPAERAIPAETAARNLPAFDIERLAAQVHNLIERRIKIARTRRGH